MIKSSVKFHEQIPYGLGVMSQTQIFSITLHGFRSYGPTQAHIDRGKELWPGQNSKNKLVRAVFLVLDTLSRYDIAICEVS